MYKLIFLSKSEIEGLRRHIEQLCVSWLNEWCLVRTSADVSCNLIDTLDFECSDNFFETKDITGGFFVVVKNSINWEKLIFSTISMQEDYPAIYRKASEKAIKGLLNSIFGDHENCTNLNVSPRHIKTFFEVVISFQHFGQLKIICPHWLWGSKAKKMKSKSLDHKLKREVLIGKSVIVANIVADMGGLPLIGLLGLKKGTILKFPKTLENKFNLSIASRQLAKVAIGKQDDKKAFIVLKEKKND